MARVVTNRTAPATRRWWADACVASATRWQRVSDHGEEEKRKGGAYRVKDGDEERRGIYPVVRCRNRNGGQHRPGAGHEDQTQAETQNESTTGVGEARGAQPSERPFDPLPDDRNMRPTARTSRSPMPNQKRRFCGSPRALRTVLPTSSVRLKLTTRPAMMRNGRPRLVPAEPPATTTGRTGRCTVRAGDQPPRKATTRSSTITVVVLRRLICTGPSLSGRGEEASGG